MLMRPEAAFPYVFAAEGAQHPPKKPPRSTSPPPRPTPPAHPRPTPQLIPRPTPPAHPQHISCTSSSKCSSRVEDASCLGCLHGAGTTQVRQWRQKRVLMRPEAAFPFVFAAEGAQHPPKAATLSHAQRPCAVIAKKQRPICRKTFWSLFIMSDGSVSGTS